MPPVGAGELHREVRNEVKGVPRPAEAEAMGLSVSWTSRCSGNHRRAENRVQGLQAEDGV